MPQPPNTQEPRLQISVVESASPTLKLWTLGAKHVGDRVAAAGTIFFLALLLLAAWPWLGSFFPVWGRVASLLGLLTTALVIKGPKVS